MRLQVITPQGLEFDGHKYAQGEEFEIPDDMRHGPAWVGAMIHNKKVKRADPVVLGTPTPPPQRKVMAPVESTPQPTPVVEEVAPAEPEPEAEGEEGADADPTKRPRGRPPIHGRYSRRDIRSEE